MFDDDHKIKTGGLLASMLASLIFALLLGSYILSIIGCIAQLFAVSQFFFNVFHLPFFSHKAEKHENEATPINNPPKGL
tara:strand:- start:170 stop:406 length:237 start_codon:yes stop_codon:yes gene_type:complete